MFPVKGILDSKLNRFFEDDWNNLFDWSNQNYSGNQTTLPSVNIKETPNEFIVEMAAPGMRKEDFQVELYNNVLKISSNLSRGNELKEGERYTRKEFSYQSFQRMFRLNKEVVDDGHIGAQYAEGILRLTLPKKEEARVKPARIIEIS